MNSLIFWEYNHYNYDFVEEYLNNRENEIFINILPEEKDIGECSARQTGFYLRENLLQNKDNAIIDDLWIRIIKKYSLEIFSVIERNLQAKGLMKINLNKLEEISIITTFNLIRIIEKNLVNQIIIFDTPHHPVSILLYYLANEMGIKLIIAKKLALHHGLTKTRRYFVTNKFPYFDNFTQSELADLKIKNLLEKQYELDGDLNDYLIDYSLNKNIYNSTHLGARWNFQYISSYLIERIYEHIRMKKYLELVNKTTKYMILFVCENFLRKRILKHYLKYVKKQIDFNIKYIYLPLQYQPEATTTPLGVPFRNFLEITKLVSKFIESGHKIYVREHPAYWHRRSSRETIILSRSKKFYESLASLKNVELISPNADHVELIKNSLFVISGTGTVLWESLFYNKNALMFGNYIYKDLPNVTKYEDSNSLTKIINSNKEFISIEKHKELIKVFLSIIGKITYIINIDNPRNSPINLKTELDFILNYSLDKMD
jgi:hypothetical protein